MKKALALAAVSVVALTGAAEARETITVVGSSTVFPFTSAVTERFAQSTDFPSPIIESTGTGGGMRLFCAGIGAEHPDLTNASRQMKKSEFELCQSNGVTSVTEMKVGFDGIVLANERSGPSFDIKRKEIFKALAAQIPVDGEIVDNPHESWSDINPDFPDIEIEVFGPPPTSGTRDAFVELAMFEGAEGFPELAALEESDEDAFEQIAGTLREDGLFIEAGENDNLIVQRLQANPNALGIFGYSFLEENSDTLKGKVVEGVAPEFDAIASGEYPIARSLFVYVKNQHIGVIPGLEQFLAEYTSDQAWGPEGYLVDIGLVPLPDDARAESRSKVLNRVEVAF